MMDNENKKTEGEELRVTGDVTDQPYCAECARLGKASIVGYPRSGLCQTTGDYEVIKCDSLGYVLISEQSIATIAQRILVCLGVVLAIALALVMVTTQL